MKPEVGVSWAGIEPGHTFKPWERGGISIELFREYAEASGDGNPMHTDDGYARDLGYPSVFAQGMLVMAFCAKYLTDLAGVGNVRRLKAKFAKQTWPGEELRFVATVSKKYRDGDRNLAEIEVRGSNLEGEEKIVCESTVVCG